ncbi:MAG: tetratricopeptide repeat protein [Spirochaetes bacterium]|nr:tetratricopeptide repeat protein [Spirochaetota bacterium]
MEDINKIIYLNSGNLPFNILKSFEFIEDVLKSNIYYNKYELLNYIKTLYFENQYKIRDIELFHLLIEIIKLKNRDEFIEIKDSDFEYFYIKAIDLGLKFKKIHQTIELYIYYINYLYNNLEYIKCEELINTIFNDFKDFLNQNQELKLKEVQILVKNSITSVKDLNEDIFEIFKKEKNYNELINFFISYNFKYITEYDLETLQNNLGFLLAFIKRENYKNFFKDDILGELNNFIGNIYFYNGYYNKAKRHFFVALKKEIPARQNEKILKLDNNIAICFYELGEFEKSLKYFKILENESSISNNKKLLSYVYSNISLLYLRNNDISLSLQIMDKVLEFKKSINDIPSYIYSLIKFINFFIFNDHEIAFKYYIQFKNIINFVNNKIYLLFNLIYQKEFENKNKLKEILIYLILKLDYYPLTLIYFFSILVKCYPKIKLNIFFQFIILKFINHLYIELKEKQFNNFFNSFVEFQDLFQIYKYIKEKIIFLNSNENNINNVENLVINIEKPTISILKKINKNKELIFPDQNEIIKYNYNELLFILMLKIYKKGKLKIKNKTYIFQTKFSKKIIKRIDFLQRFYVEKFVFEILNN